MKEEVYLVSTFHIEGKTSGSRKSSGRFVSMSSSSVKHIASKVLTNSNQMENLPCYEVNLLQINDLLGSRFEIRWESFVPIISFIVVIV